MHPERREALEARLRTLPPPPVPGGLEARVLAAIPVEKPRPRRRAARLGAVGALAAACLLAVLAWPERDIGKRISSPALHPVKSQPRDESDGFAAWREARRDPDGAEPPVFTWPLHETSPVRPASIPPDLLD
jgi:hypothetical protein